ncbi:unnamed protein product [Cylindrotheca closterium]|uniref:Uncharacterized protein n=1 Tax=Cylindrotheca closterium TaxID=2856 RepID=A0AAD2FRI5_9STRA|nr:unnamed protein product [Cylindrotheca closterium]
MANTEGMSDEFVASLMTTPVSKPTSASKGGKKITEKDSSMSGSGVPDIMERPQKASVNRRRRKGAPIMSAVTNQRLQERMEMPMPEGGQPSAQVIRSSQSSNTAVKTGQEPKRISTSQISERQQVNSRIGGPTTPETPGVLPPSIVGDVVEHSVSPMERKTTRFQRKQNQSRFSQQAKASQFQQQQHQEGQSNNAGPLLPNAGFPSVHMPIGTFVKKPKQSQRSTTKGKKPTRKPIVAEKPPSEQDSMQQASARDATNMLAQMSMEDIQSHQRDLEAALSPDIKAFLKARSQQKNKKKQQQDQTEEPVVGVEEDATPEPTESETPIMEKKKTEKNPQQEKERLAKLMSSVRTHHDLDQAYHQEMQQAHPLEHEPLLDAGEQGTTDASTLPNDNSRNDPVDKDFDMACDLLRSTVKRQTLWAARLVSQSLSERVRELQQEKLGHTSSKTSTTKKNWPLLLPISLRCLMDEPIHGQGILHTYVLQALYSLLVLNAVDDHLVWVDSSTRTGRTMEGGDNKNNQNGELPTIATDLSSSRWSEKDMYQHFFMEDAIPTPPLDTAYPSNTVQPLAVDTGKSSSSVAAYSTSSSSTSAMEDAKAFEKDPMWTLLSKMRIIPRLSQLLCPKNDALMLPEEAWIASCGILAMLGQRSPGAATVIVHQKSMFEQILDRCLMRYSLERQQPGHQLEEIALLEQVAFASIQLLLTLARQSRVTAKAMAPHMEEVLPALLLPSDGLSPLELRLQKMGIILWRTLMRYGLGLPGFATMLKMAAHHWALPHTNPSSLSAEYLSAFTQILECARVAQSKTSALDKAKTKPIIDEESMRILSMVPTHLAATQRQLLLPSAPASDSDPSSLTTQSVDACREFQWKAARLRFLSSYWSLAANTSQSTANQEVKVEEIAMEDELAFLENLDLWTDPGGVLEVAWKLVWQQESEDYEDLAIGTPKEAAASAFLSSFANTLVEMDMSRTSQKNRMVQQLTKAVVKHFVERIIEGCKRTRILSGNEKGDLSTWALPRQGWMNQCYFAVAKLLFHAYSIGVLTSSSDINQARMLVFFLLANLERGQEAVAAVLFSQDVLFMPSGNPLHDSSSGSSPISTLFLGEICGSEMARKQLDHSFKLQHGFGLTVEGYGPFALDSLLSATDRMGPKTNGELILPLGNLWLLQTLSGSIQMKQQTVDKGTNEAVRVVSTALGLLLELEEAEEIDATCRWYSPSIPVGAKMYYLLNVCLHPETILRDERIAEASGALFEKYCSQLNETSLFELSQACLHHTEPAKKEVADPEVDQDTEEKEKALLDKLLNSNMTTDTLSPEAMRSLEALLEDVIAAFRDYGAQYSFFTKCVRLFLSPVYPPSIRCRTMQELRGMLHLLTLPDDSKSDEELLEVFLSGGLPAADGSTKDASSVLDALAVAVAKESSDRNLDGFFLHFVVATLGRNLASSISDEIGSLSMMRRLNRIPSRISSLVCDFVLMILKEKGSKKEMAVAAVKACADGKADDNFVLESRIASIREGLER